MAKRKKKPGSGGFGKNKSVRGNTTEEPEIIDRTRTAETSLKHIDRILSLKDFGSEEEMQAYFENEILTRQPEELVRIADEIDPPDELERANRIIEDLPDGTTTEELIDAARKAIRLSPDCLTGWLALAVNEPDDDKALELTDAGIGFGREFFAEKIDSIDDELGLWGHIPARDLLRLMFNKGKLHEERRGEFDEAEAAYRKCLTWNPRDNQGVRGHLLCALMVRRRLDEAQDLIDLYPGDNSTAMAWGRALLAIVRAMDGTGYEPPESDISDEYSSPRDYLNSLGPEFDDAKQLVREAARRNPFVPLLIMEAGLFELEIPGMFVANGPFDAADYLRKWAIVWQISGLPMVMMSDAVPKNMKARLNGPGIQEEFMDIAAQLDEHDGQPWWEILHGHVEDETNP